MRVRWLAILIILMFPGAANAEWLQASSAHFVVYANDVERDVVRFSEQLERYHAAMAQLTRAQNAIPSPSNRVTVFVVRNERDVQRLHGGNNPFVGGFYRPRAGDSIAVVSTVDAARGGDLNDSMLTLLHEYAHHFVISRDQFPLPRWMSEGSAEFFASASFNRDGSVTLGRPAQHRAYELHYATEVGVANLLDPDTYEKRNVKGYTAFYGESWLLYHYLLFSEERRGQLDRYVASMQEGKSSREAAVAAFGDFDQLQRDLGSYLRKGRMKAVTLSASALAIGPIAIRRLTPGEVEMMPVVLRSRTGVNAKSVGEVLAQARGIAARFPGDAAVQTALAEAEFDAGNDKEAIAAADRALALDGTRVNAYVQKGYAQFRMARKNAGGANGDSGGYAAARRTFLALNKMEPDHPIPLIYFYRSFLEEGKRLTDNARDALAQALALAPFDVGVRLAQSRQLLADGKRDEARRTRAPAAYNPHGGSTAEFARGLIARIDGEPAWNGIDGWDDADDDGGAQE